ncbi:hypothetical protein P8452_43164 [Trifolium repens]|nr:ALA-interacting subunit [Trifolium repens]WJX57624.1 hypothetical protein P8452_43164 [Trifolium repens]
MQVVEVRLQYDDVCIFNDYKDDAIAYIKDEKIDKACRKTLDIKKKMKAPIYVYYELDNFYQNHRRYVQSRSVKQLRSKAGEKEVRSCRPLGHMTNHQPVVPCGLIEWSLFNDTYKISRYNKDLMINKKDIAWKSDKTANLSQTSIRKIYRLKV